jgi:hypothetical protein
MNTETIETAIDKYVQERMEQGKKRAREHFIAYAYLKYGGGEIKEFMKRAAGLSRYYMEFLRVMKNPFKGPEIAWFASMVMVGVFSCCLMGVDEERLLGIMVFAGTLVHFFSLVWMVARKWSEIGVKIAIYREIAEIADSEMAGAV